MQILKIMNVTGSNIYAILIGEKQTHTKKVESGRIVLMDMVCAGK